MTYRVSEFAALTGVTVRALQHYDRLGLLKPSRTESGHRIYRRGDEKRVRHILALRAVGMSLQHIAELLDAPSARQTEALRAQRARLEQSRAGIEDAIRALQQFEAASDSMERPLDQLATAVDTQDALEAMRRYFSDEAWTKWGEQYFYDWPPAAWRVLFRDIEASLDQDPSSDRAQELLDRATTLWDGSVGSDPTLSRAVREGYGKAWQSRDRWPRELRRRYAEFRIDAIAKFLGATAMASWRRRGLVRTYTTGRQWTA
jgi:MerR family transcriptional regulator, thiopeptide resistance regulator